MSAFRSWFRVGNRVRNRVRVMVGVRVGVRVRVVWVVVQGWDWGQSWYWVVRSGVSVESGLSVVDLQFTDRGGRVRVRVEVGPPLTEPTEGCTAETLRRYSKRILEQG